MKISIERFFKAFSFLLVLSGATLFVGNFGIHRVYAFTCSTSCPVRAKAVADELVELKKAGIGTYIYWQYSGTCSNPWADSNDQYSFFHGDPLCKVFKTASADMTVGVNIHHLSTHLADAGELKYLHDECGVSIVRFWAYPNIGSGANTARATVDAITSAGMHAIPVICDYSNTCTDLGITGATQSNPTSWYQTEYKGAYQNYALQLKNALSGASLFGIELLNEPHCGGKSACVQPYSNWASDMVGVLSGFTTGIGQKASENTTRGDSPGAGSPSDFTVSNASVGMASAHFYNPPEKALALEAASQASSLGKTFYIGERGFTCEGVEGEAPGGSSQTKPLCAPNQYSLTIKGTIKSSEVFAVQKNELTGETVLTNRRNIPKNQWVNYSFTNNQPVNGAIVAVYPSYAFTGSDNYGNQIVYSPGKRSGKLHAEDGVNYVKVKGDGNYEITTSNTCNEVWQYGGWKQYLVVMCPEKRNGATKPVVKDLYAFPLNKADAEVTMQDINVPCDADLTNLGNVAVPPDLEYMVRDPQNFLACGATLTFPSATTPYKAENWDDPLLFKDYISVKLPWPIGGFSGIVEWLINEITKNRMFKGSREGFIGIERTSCDIRSQFSSPIELYGGVKTDSVELAKYFLNGNSSVDTYNNFEQKLPLPSCTELRDCSMAVSFNGENNNMQSCGGMVNNLRAPCDTSVTNAAGDIVADEFGYAARYRSTAKSIEVCKDSDSPGAVRHTLEEIAPPECICGDTNLNRKIDPGIEMPCPTDPNCGDRDNDGSIVAPETICSSGGGVTYKFDSRYFPYDVLYTQTTEPKGNLIEERQKSYNDAVSRPLEGGRDTPFGSADGTRPNNSGPTASKFPEGYSQTKFPAGLYSSDAKRMDMGGSSASRQNPASLVLSDPVNFGGTVDSNTIRSVLNTLSNNIVFDSTVEFYKIGMPDSLCTCSTVENGANGTKTCINAEKAAVQTKLPLSLFNNLSDWDIYGNGYSDLLGESSIHILQPGYKFAGDSRADAANNADFIKSYYKQKMNAAYDFIDAIVELLTNQCESDGLEDIRTNGVVTGQAEKGHCQRLLPTISKNKTMVPWAPDMSETKNALISMVALDQPFVPKVRTVSLCEIDSSQTKSQDPSLDYGLGQEWMWASKSDNVAQAATFMKNSVSSPTFGGLTNQCTTISGWNVKEYPGQGLFAADCLEDGSMCWVTGSFGHENWSGTSTFIAKSTDSGSNWSVNSPVGPFVHGLGLGDGLKLANGQGGIFYNLLGSSTFGIRGRPGTAFNKYTAFLYDVAGGLGGYVAGGTSFGFYSQNGTTWDVLNKKDDKGAFCQANPYSCSDRVGCESIFWPTGCTPYNYNTANPNCDNNNATPLPQCCCEGVAQLGDADGDPNTPNCTGCWKWGEGSIWGADCNKDGDCIMAGQAAPYSWRARKSDVSSCALSNPLDPLDCITGVWWRDKADMSSTSAGCSGPGRVGSCQAWSVAYPGTDTAYASLGGRADVYDGRIDPAKGTGDGGGAINKSMDGGRSWQQQTIPAGLVTSLRGIDCFSETECVAVGTNAVILKTFDGGTTWTEFWKDNQEIKDAKTANVQFLGVAYPSVGTVVAVGYIPNTDGSVKKGVIYTLGEKEDCTEPPDIEPPISPSPPGPPAPPLPPGSCPHTLQIDRCACDGVTVSDPGRNGSIIGDMGVEIKGTGGTFCYTWVSWWRGEPWSTSCSVAPGTYTCHLWGSYGDGVCNTNMEQSLTCP